MHIMVIMSTYNGEKYLARQLDSILAQQGVEVSCYVRDDGSTDSTYSILEKYGFQYNNFYYSLEENIGCALSFLKALKDCPKADYYAFADQDDYWYSNKLSMCIKMMNANDRAQLVHCNHRRTNASLEPLEIPNSVIIEKPKTYKNALTQAYLRGCSGIINQAARELINRTHPSNMGIFFHDAWIGLICFLFGDVYYIKEPLFDYVSHENNVSTAGNDKLTLKRRRKQIFKTGAYMNFACVLLDYYSDLLSEEEKDFLNIVKKYRNNILYRIKLVLDPGFIRLSLWGTISLKLHILLGMY